MATSGGSSTQADSVRVDESERAHFLGFGDPQHKPSVLQTIASQRYQGIELSAHARQVDARERTAANVYYGEPPPACSETNSFDTLGTDEYKQKRDVLRASSPA